MSVDALPAPAPSRESQAAPAATSSRASERSLPRASTVVALLVLMLGSLYLRTRGLHVHLWVDEGLSVGIARHPLSKIPHLLREDGSPPLYYMLLHVWMSVFGSSESAVHALSLIHI